MAKKKNKEKDNEKEVREKEKDVRIRRRSKSPQKLKQTKVVERAPIFSDMENEKIRLLFEEIKQA